MKILFQISLIAILFLPISIKGQWDYLGLGNRTATKIELVNNELYVGTDSGIYNKDNVNPDTLWTFLGLTGRKITDFIVFNTDTVLASTKTNNIGADTISLFITYDGGTTWTDFQNGFGGSSGIYNCSAIEINPFAPDTIYARPGIGVVKSTDFGNSWQEIYLNWGMGGFQDFIFTIDPQHPNIIWAGGETGFFQPYLLKSIDYANNWQLIQIDAGGDNACYSLITHPNDFNRILVGMEGRIITSNDGGANWNQLFTSPTYAYIMAMKNSPNNSDLIYATGSKNGTSGGALFFYKSYDFGITWDTTDYTGSIATFYTNDLAIRKAGTEDELYFATNNGIYKYSNHLTSTREATIHENIYWTLQPNPVGSYAILTFDNLNNSDFTLNIFDVQGRPVQTIDNITSNQVTIYKNNLDGGLYFFQMCSDIQNCFTGKMIIK